MVHVATPRPSIGGALGQALGAVGGEQYSYQRNRGRLQEALSQVEQNAQNPQATPLQTTLSFLNAMAGIPGSERYVGTILPMIQQQANAQRLYGGGQPISQDQGQQRLAGQPINQPFQSQVALQPELKPQAQPQTGPVSPQGASQEVPFQTGGLLPRVMPLEEMDSEARQAAQITGNPGMYQQRLNELMVKNQAAEQAQGQARQRLQGLGIASNEIDEAMKIGQKYSHFTNLDQWTNAVKKDWNLYKNNKDKLLGIFTPGFFTGLISGAQGREKALKRLDPVVKDMLNQGFESETRAMLAQQGLSPTEVEERIHPLSKTTESMLKSYPEFKQKTHLVNTPAGPRREKIPLSEEEDQKFNKQLVNFFEKNLEEGGSLSAIRHKLAIDKNIPWEKIGPAIREAATKKGIALTPDQQREMVEIETQPPRQSLSDIFTDWFRPIEYIKGAK